LAKVVAIIPVKPFDESKSRLSPVLKAEQRAALAQAWFLQTLDRARKCPAIDQIIVVSRSTWVLDAARTLAATALEEREPGLNAALSHATEVAIGKGADAVCVIPTDLPLLTVDGLSDLLAQGIGAGGCLLVPDRREQGTNFLFVRPPVSAFYRFGADSFRRHRHAAIGANLRPSLVYGSAASFDIDEPGDWEEWQRGLAERAVIQALVTADIRRHSDVVPLEVRSS